jgi:Fanconi anemia group D2 protein
MPFFCESALSDQNPWETDQGKFMTLCLCAQVVECLENVIESNTQCINAVLDALSSFSLEPDQLFKVTEKIVSLLDSADPEDLPVMVRYLLQSTGDTILKDTVKSLRKSISFISSAEDDAGHVQFSQSATSRRGEGEVLTLEAVRSAIKFRKSIATVLIQEIASVEEAGDHMPFDVWSLVLIRSIGDAKRQAEVDRVFRSKVRSNLFQESLIRNSLVRHADALKPYFKEFRALAHQFVRANDTELSSFGTMLYTLIFKVFSDDCSRQEVLSDVMAHIGAGPCMEVDAALKVLDNLVNEDGRLLKPFAVYIKSILDYLENLATKEHVRTLFRILAKLSVGTPSATGGDVRLDDEVHNKITKLLHATEGKFFQLGVIGAISVVIVLSTKTDESEMSAVGDHLETQATSLLSKIRSNCENNVSSSIFMFDEMADAFNIALTRGIKIKEGTRRWIDSFTEDFDQTYLPEIAEDAPVTGIHNIHKSVTVKADMNLNRPEMLVCLEVFSMIDNETDKLRKMCSFFRVMSMSQMANSGNLEEIDALLGMYSCQTFPAIP